MSEDARDGIREHDDHLRRAWELYEDSLLADAVTQRERLLVNAIAEAEVAAESAQANEDATYALGRFWYDWPIPSEMSKGRAYQYLKHVIKNNPAHLGARMYLGHQYFDDQRYESALDVFASIDRGEVITLADGGRSWRYAKMVELMLCCRLYLDPADVSLEDVGVVDQEYFEFVKSEEMPAPMPIESIRCALRLCSRDDLADSTRSVLSAIADMAERIEGAGGGALAKEISELRSRLQA